MKKALIHCFTLTAVAALCGACATRPSEPARLTPQNSTLVTIALIMGEPNFAMDGGYQELEEGLYTAPELKAGKKMFAPIQEIIPLLGGEVKFDAAGARAEYRLAGTTVTLQAGSKDGQRNGEPFKLDQAPEVRNGALWVPLEAVFTQWGAYSKWEEARQRYSATFVLPRSAKLEDLARGGPVIESNMTEQPAAFYASAQGRQLADVVLAYQNADGGWPKIDRDINMLRPINTAHLSGVKAKSTIDNDSTMKQVRLLGRAYEAFGDERYRKGFERGLDYLLAAQLENGGWQQFWPAPIGYKQRITFNDDAIANVLEVMRDISTRSADFRFVDSARHARATAAFERGVALILRTQLVVAGRKTGWCAQYDENTLEPARGRAFELASISGHESVNVVRFLMSLDKPSPAVIAAVESAVSWFDAARMPGIRRLKREDRTLENGFDYVIQRDPAAPPIWARFYDLTKGEPLFTSRDGVPRKTFEEVAYERRVKYNWFTTLPAELLERDYPQWAQQWTPGRRVVK